MKKKKIFLNTDKTKYCWVKLFKTKKEMQAAYKKFKPQDGNHDEVLGVHCGYEKWIVKKGKKTICHPETGIVFLSKENCGAGVVTHELMHAILWARGHKMHKRQHPIVIKSMEEEEAMLHNHTYAVMQFYDWYWKIEKKI